MERAALYVLKTYLYKHTERTLGVDALTPTTGYLWISVFFGVYDLSPILVAVLSDTFLGAYKSIVLFGFVFVFGCVLILLQGGSVIANTVPAAGIGLAGLLLVAASAGGLVQLLTAFGASQFHPQAQSASGTRFFSLIFTASNFGALLGIVVAISLYALTKRFSPLLFSVAGLALLGWVSFVAGSWLYVNRCVHAQTAQRTVSLMWNCVKRFSFEKNRTSNGGAFKDSLVDDVRLLFRLLPVFVCLIPCYLGQLQVTTTLRSIGYKLMRPEWGANKERVPIELLLVTEPVTMILLSCLLNEVVFPFLQARRRLPTHLTRLTIAAGLVALGFVLAFVLQRVIMTAGTEVEVLESVSMFYLIGPLMLFAAGQSLITSSGLELSYSHAPEALRAVSVSLFSTIYSLGSVVAVGLFGAMRGSLDEAGRRGFARVASDSHGLTSRFDIYFAICAGLCLLGMAGLVALRRFHAATREMKIERAVERRAVEIALRRGLPERRPAA